MNFDSLPGAATLEMMRHSPDPRVRAQHARVNAKIERLATRALNEKRFDDLRRLFRLCLPSIDPDYLLTPEPDAPVVRYAPRQARRSPRRARSARTAAQPSDAPPEPPRLPRSAVTPGPLGAREPWQPSRYREPREVLFRVGKAPRGRELDPEPASPWRGATGRPSRANFAAHEAARADLRDDVKRQLVTNDGKLTPTGHDVLAHLETRAEHPESGDTRVARPRFLAFVGGRSGWVNGVWLELMKPPADVVQSHDLWECVDLAVWRFERNERRDMSNFHPQPVLTCRGDRHD